MQGPAIPGFYSPALAQMPQPPTPPTAPAFPQPRPGLPPSLVPGRASTSSIPRAQSNDFFFQQGSMFPIPRHSQTAPVPPLPRKPDFDQPPLPPKPMLSPPVPPSPHEPNGFAAAQSSPSYFASPEPTPLPLIHSPPPVPSAPPLHAAAEDDHDDILKRVLEMSAQESRDASAQPTEEELIARAMQESLRFSPPTMSPLAPPPRQHAMTSSPEQNPIPIPDVDFSAGSSSYAAAAHAPPPLPRLPSPPRAGSSHPGSSYFPSGEARGSRPHVAQQISEDEALARQLAQEEEQLLEEERRKEAEAAADGPPAAAPPQPSSNSTSPAPPDPADLPPPPQYDEAVVAPAPGSFYNSTVSAHFPAPNGAGPNGSAPARLPSLGRSISANPAPPKPSSSPDLTKRLSRSQSLGDRDSSAAASASGASASVAAASSSASLLPVGTHQGERPRSTTSSTLGSIDEGDGSPSEANGSSPGGSSGVEVVSNTQYLDAELLAGLCKSSAAWWFCPVAYQLDFRSPRVRDAPHHVLAQAVHRRDSERHRAALWAMSSIPYFGPQLAVDAQAHGAPERV